MSQTPEKTLLETFIEEDPSIISPARNRDLFLTLYAAALTGILSARSPGSQFASSIEAAKEAASYATAALHEYARRVSKS